MARKPFVVDLQQRERRQASYLAMPSVAERFPALAELAVELRFTDRTGKPFLSPYRRLFVPTMQAYFQLECPTRECTGGGFDLGEPIGTAVSGGAPAGTLHCRGRRPQEGAADDACAMQLRYTISVVKR